jgi:hypothetical protein
MTDSNNVEGRLVALHWPKLAAEVTLSDDTNQLQEVTAEIEDRAGVTHKVEVFVKWDADFLIGKEVSTSPTAQGETISLLS